MRDLALGFTAVPAFDVLAASPHARGMDYAIRSIPLLFALVTVACGDDDGGGTGTTTTAEGSGSDTGSSSGGSSGGSSGTSTGTSSGSESGTSSTGVDSSSSGEGSSTTGIDVESFERFVMSSAAGLCKPGVDCDGFVELLANGTLRVEIFGDVTETVTEVDISDEDLEAAIVVFADPALIELLDGPEPLCKPPTDIFENMTVELDGTSHDAATTFCDQPPIAAAREMAIGLRMEYVPQ